ncbi:unnamed protein product [Eruca vesicaria subsp. sativa]|uniref:DDT domain-containing protein n=1 Tax=Eruca vesicaria subsp. sativa TaxID=29727 RepID=A0ABC8KRG6_ERUVS|nr:unnamed protein product [Eruca vesicaria subsp. sativa]
MAMEITNLQIVDPIRIVEPMKYCHQCRKEKSDIFQSCKAKKGTKTCLLKYCPKCLLTRYGETAEETAQNDDWVCPRCRKICNCSTCRKNEGKKAAGNLLATAKKNGCSSVSEFLMKEEGKTGDVIGLENSAEENHVDEVKLPQGIKSITVSNVDLHPENAGSVLQFLEFCLTFREVLGLSDGQAQLVVREVLSGGSMRSQEQSTLTQMMIQLLTLLLVDRGEISVCMNATDDRWFTILGECLAKSKVKLDDFPPEMFQKGISEYEEMDSLQRLKLLNFLCDEVLGISYVKNFIENHENLEYVEKKNEAEAKEKQLYQKIKDDFAKVEADNNGVALTIEKRVAILSQMSAESEEVYFEKKKALEMKPNSQEAYDALRTNPVEVDDNGIFWNLKSYNEEPPILLQGMKETYELSSFVVAKSM